MHYIHYMSHFLTGTCIRTAEVDGWGGENPQCSKCDLEREFGVLPTLA